MNDPTYDPLIDARRIVKKFRTASGSGLRTVLSIDRLTLPAGKIIAVLGPSGSGKSTLFNILSGLDKPTGREAEITLHLPGERARRIDHWGVRYPRRDVSYVFQHGYLLNHASIALNIAIPRQAAGYLADQQILEYYRDLVGLEASQFDTRAQAARAVDPYAKPMLHLSTPVSLLSGGEQQRVGIARALARNPKLMLCDEPTSSVDPVMKRDIVSMLTDWIEQGEGRRTMLWATHNYELAAAFADEVLILRKGGQLIDESRETGRPIPNPRDAAVLERLVYGASARATAPADRAAPPDRIAPTVAPVTTTPADVEQPEPGFETQHAFVAKHTMPPAEPQQTQEPASPRTARPIAYASVDASGKPKPPQDPKYYRRRFRGLGLLTSGIAWGVQELYEPLTTSRKGNPLLRAITAPIRWTHAAVANYRDLSAAAIVCFVTLLGVALLATERLVDEHFTKRVNDPALRHVIVAGSNLDERAALTEAKLKTFNETRPWQVAAVADAPAPSALAWVQRAWRTIAASLGGESDQSTAPPTATTPKRTAQQPPQARLLQAELKTKPNAEHSARPRSGASPKVKAAADQDDAFWDELDRETAPKQHPSCSGANATVFGRDNGTKHTIKLKDAFQGRGGDGASVELRILKADHNELALRSIKIFDPVDTTKGKLRGTLGDLFQKACGDTARPMTVVLTPRGLRRLKDRLGFKGGGGDRNPLLSIRTNTEFAKLKVLGLAKTPIYDRDYQFDAVMDHRSFAKWRKLADYNFAEFTRGAFYFEATSFKPMQAWLFENRFEYDLEIFTKFGSLLDIANRLSSLFTFLLWLGAFVSIAVVLALFLGKLKQREAQYAVLRAQGVGSLAIVPAMVVQIGFIWFSAFFAAALVLVISWSSGALSQVVGNETKAVPVDDVVAMAGALGLLALFGTLLTIAGGLWLTRGGGRLADVLRPS
ncbi:MAG: ATP-binding cassette domain-containing protein [Pseudomonadota bacterium]